MIRSSGLPSPHQHRSCRALPHWQRLLLGCYIALFALVLPFLCWGALAEPGHPHRSPHFVFTDPTPNKPMQAGKALTADLHGGAHPVAAKTTNPAAVCPLQPIGSLAGRATPTLLLFTILLLLLTAMCGFDQTNRTAVACWLQPLFAQARFIAVPLPPPRTHSSLFA